MKILLSPWLSQFCTLLHSISYFRTICLAIYIETFRMPEDRVYCVRSLWYTGVMIIFCSNRGDRTNLFNSKIYEFDYIWSYPLDNNSIHWLILKPGFKRFCDFSKGSYEINVAFSLWLSINEKIKHKNYYIFRS